MKNFLAGVVAGVALLLFVAESASILNDKYPKNKVIKSVHFWFFDPSIGASQVITGRCTKYIRDPESGQTGREYFQCNKLQIFASDIYWGKELLHKEVKNAKKK